MKRKHLVFLSLIIFTVVCCVGCVQRYAKIVTPEGHELTVRVPSLGSKSKIKSATLKVDGVTIILEGYESDQVQAFKAGLEAGAKTLAPLP